MAKKILRRIQKIGNSSYAIVLPKNWIKDLKLEKSDHLAVELEGSKLSIYPSHKVSEKEELEYTIKVSEDEKVSLIIRMFISAYLLGARSIKVEAKEKKLPATLKDELKKYARDIMIGIEVVEESLEKITFQELVSWPSMNLFGLIRRMHSIAMNMVKDSYSALINDDDDIRESVVSSDTEVDKFYFYGIRVLNEVVYNRDMLQSFGLTRDVHILISKSLLKNIERIADHAVSIASIRGFSISESDRRKLQALYEKVLSFFEKSYEALVSQDKFKANEIIDYVQEIRKEMENYSSILQNVIEHFERIAEYTSDIAENIIDYSVSNEVLKY